MAVFTVVFDQPLYLSRSREPGPVLISDVNVTGGGLDGIVRLECEGGSVIPSSTPLLHDHLSSSGAAALTQLLPLGGRYVASLLDLLPIIRTQLHQLDPTSAAQSWPPPSAPHTVLATLAAPALHADTSTDGSGANVFTCALVVDSSFETLDADGSRRVVERVPGSNSSVARAFDPALLPGCRLRFLSESAQLQSLLEEFDAAGVSAGFFAEVANATTTRLSNFRGALVAGSVALLPASAAHASLQRPPWRPENGTAGSDTSGEGRLDNADAEAEAFRFADATAPPPPRNGVACGDSAASACEVDVVLVRWPALDGSAAASDDGSAARGYCRFNQTAVAGAKARRNASSHGGEGDEDAAAFVETADQTAMREKVALGLGGLVTDDGEYLSAIELGDMMQTGFPMLKEVFGEVVGGALGPVSDAFVKGVVGNVAEHVANNIAEQSDGEVNDDVANMLKIALTYNLTAVLQDAIVARVNKVLTEHIANPVAARISYEMQKTVGTKAFDIMTITMRSTIANRVAHSLPALLERTLLPRLTKTLTHSLTHALVPTLAITLTHSPEQDWFCNQCFYRHAHCRECHYSSQSQYYTEYYATYYSDYYSDYYSRYYGNAVDEIMKKQTIERPTPAGAKAAKPVPPPWKVTPKPGPTPDCDSCRRDGTNCDKCKPEKAEPNDQDYQNAFFNRYEATMLARRLSAQAKEAKG